MEEEVAYKARPSLLHIVNEAASDTYCSQDRMIITSPHDRLNIYAPIFCGCGNTWSIEYPDCRRRCPKCLKWHYRPKYEVHGQDPTLYTETLSPTP